MARLLKELVKLSRPHPTATRFISTFFTRENNPSSFTFTAPHLFANQLSFPTLNPPNNGGFGESDIAAAQLGKVQIYPSFSIGYFIDPNSRSGSVLDETIRPGMVVGSEHPGMMWADSVKKKRKKKMNKHKYKKLRKRLRRKTKT